MWMRKKKINRKKDKKITRKRKRRRKKGDGNKMRTRIKRTWKKGR